jgi:hypothetical protein
MPQVDFAALLASVAATNTSTAVVTSDVTHVIIDVHRAFTPEELTQVLALPNVLSAVVPANDAEHSFVSVQHQHAQTLVETLAKMFKDTVIVWGSADQYS